MTRSWEFFLKGNILKTLKDSLDVLYKVNNFLFFQRLTKGSLENPAIHNCRGLPVDHPVRDCLVLFTELLLTLSGLYRGGPLQRMATV